MPRHILDKPKTRDDGARARRYLIIERSESGRLHPASISLLRRAKGSHRPELRALAFHRIDRGYTA